MSGFPRGKPGETAADVDILVTAGAGPGLRARLARFGVQVIITDILLPDQALDRLNHALGELTC